MNAGNVTEVRIRGEKVRGVFQDGKTFVADTLPDDSLLTQELRDNNVTIIAEPTDENVPTLMNVLVSWFPMLLLIAVWIFFMRQMQSGGGKGHGFRQVESKTTDGAPRPSHL